MEDDLERRSKEIKKRLAADGFQVFRTLQTEIVLADRVRDNLIMDSGVRVCLDGDGYAVRCVVRSQRSDHPQDTDAEGMARARALAAGLSQSGYQAVEERTSPIEDPNVPGRELDLWCELVLEKRVADWPELVDELRRALAAPKLA